MMMCYNISTKPNYDIHKICHSESGRIDSTNQRSSPDEVEENGTFSELRMEKMLDIMEDDDDVQNVWHNWEQE